MSTAVAERLEIDEFLAMPGNEDYELIDGVMRERCMSLESIWVSGEIFGQVRDFNQVSPAGVVFPDGLPLAIFEDRPRYAPRPDGVFISTARFSASRLRQASLTVAPELAVEVVSPNDAAREVEDKVRSYLGAGIDTVWVAYPDSRTVHVYRREGPAEVLTDGDVLRGDGPLSGLEIDVTSIFPPPADGDTVPA